MIRQSRDLFALEPMKYQSFPSNHDATTRRERVQMYLESGKYIYSIKTDGNWGRFVKDEDRAVIQSRGISKKTKTYGEVQEKVKFFEDMKSAFKNTTILIGEIYLDEGVDKDVGAIIRCLPEKALSRQTPGKELKYRIFDCFYYEGISLLEAPITERIKYLPKAVEAINNELVSYVKYYEAKPETFWDKLNNIFEAGGEGVVLYHKDMTPCEGRTPAGQTLKIKQELQCDADCFICGIEPAEKEYTGKELSTWPYWFNEKTNEFITGNHYSEYVKGALLTPITKSYYHGWPGAIKCAVYDENGEQMIICKCANLTEEMREDLKNNYEDYHLRPVRVNGMTISNDRFGNLSIRHPKLIGIRDYEDIDVEKDCTLAKILGKG